MTEHKIKEQTKKHQKKMKEVADEIIDCGFTPDDIIDVGDYLLNLMTVEELRGGTTKATDKKAAKSDITVSGAKKGKRISKAKLKAKKGKGKG